MLDDSLLDHPEALANADHGGLLRGAAEAGALVRTAARQAGEAGIAALRPDGHPRALLVAGPGPSASCVADLLAAFTHGAVPVTCLRPTGSGAQAPELRWNLPGWAGPLDLLLIATPDGSEQGLEPLAEQAYRRGCTVLSVCPPGSLVAEAVSPPRGLTIPLAEPPHVAETAYDTGSPARPAASPGALWALLTPLLMLVDRLGLHHTSTDAVEELAVRLDQVAERCGPATAMYDNPAKSLAVELSDSLPLLWSETPVAYAAARHFATVLGALPGHPALTAPLPEALLAQQAVLTGMFGGGNGEDDIFRDRVEEARSLRARVVLLHDQTTPAHDQTTPGESALPAARELAHAHQAALSELSVREDSSPLEAAAELIATADFTAVYLTLTPHP